MTGTELRRLRRSLGWTQVALARAVGVHPNSIARQERGELGIKEPLARLVRLLVKMEKGNRRERPTLPRRRRQ
jgi:transcriptional regulator with XRE-family HTH domain